MLLLLLAAPWLILGIPFISVVRGLELRRRARFHYSYYLQWKQYPIMATVAGKILLFPAIGFIFVLDPASPDKTFVSLLIIGVLGNILEATVVRDRPFPTRNYMIALAPCANCRAGEHDDCTNLRMLDGFEKGFKDEKGL